MKKSRVNTISVFEFFALFPDEKSAVKFMESQVWAGGVICVYCSSNKTNPRPKRHGHRCNACRKDFTVRHGTIFENSRLPLKSWLYAIYLLQTSRKGISSLQLSKELGITQKSAWFMLHRIREACNVDGAKLEGVVEVDETYLGGKQKNKHGNKRMSGRGTVGKQAIVGLRERSGRVKAVPVSKTNMKTLQGIIQRNVKEGSKVYTDEAGGYTYLHTFNYDHSKVNHSAKEYVNGMVHTNGIESVWAVIKRGFNGVYHNWSKKHTARYVNEFTFRLNDGNCKTDTIDLIKSLCSASAGKRLTYKELIS